MTGAARSGERRVARARRLERPFGGGNVEGDLGRMDLQGEAHAHLVTADAQFLFGAGDRGTVYSRTEALARANGLVGSAWTALKDGFYSEESSRLLVIEYDLLARKPLEVLKLVYDFVDEMGERVDRGLRVAAAEALAQSSENFINSNTVKTVTLWTLTTIAGGVLSFAVLKAAGVK